MLKTWLARVAEREAQRKTWLASAAEREAQRQATTTLKKRDKESTKEVVEVGKEDSTNQCMMHACTTTLKKKKLYTYMIHVLLVVCMYAYIYKSGK